MYIHPMGAELFHEDRRTDMMKLTVVFLNFAEAPKKGKNGIVNYTGDNTLLPSI
jgi:hypothetical protein